MLMYISGFMFMVGLVYLQYDLYRLEKAVERL